MQLWAQMDLAKVHYHMLYPEKTVMKQEVKLIIMEKIF